MFQSQLHTYGVVHIVGGPTFKHFVYTQSRIFAFEFIAASLPLFKTCSWSLLGAPGNSGCLLDASWSTGVPLGCPRVPPKNAEGCHMYMPASRIIFAIPSIPSVE